MNTMQDLREEVASRMHETLHGREIDEYENRVQIEHMLGITPIGEEHKPKNENGTILDADHEFWEDWHKKSITGWTVRQKVETAVRSLHEDGFLRVTYPYGEDAEVAYVEVDDLGADDTSQVIVTCDYCGEVVAGRVSISKAGIHPYTAELHVNCPECGNESTYIAGFTENE
jgi:ribosomal protein S27E